MLCRETMKTALLALASTLALFCLAHPASAQTVGGRSALRTPVLRDAIAYTQDASEASPASGALGPGELSLSYAPPPVIEPEAGVAFRHTGTTMMVVGLSANVMGAVGGVLGFAFGFECGGDFCGVGALSIASLTTGITISVIGLASFFVGLGLDIRGRILRGQSRAISLRPDGLVVAF